MKKVNYREIVNLLNSSDVEIIKLGISYLLDLNLIDEKTFQNIIEEYNTRIWRAEDKIDLIMWALQKTIPEFKGYEFKSNSDMPNLVVL